MNLATKIRTAGKIAKDDKVLAHGVEGLGCDVLQRKLGKTQVTDAMDPLEENIGMNVF